VPLQIFAVIVSFISAYIVGWKVTQILITLIVSCNNPSSLAESIRSKKDLYGLISVFAGLGATIITVILLGNLPESYSLLVSAIMLPLAIFFLVKPNTVLEFLSDFLKRRAPVLKKQGKDSSPPPAYQPTGSNPGRINHPSQTSPTPPVDTEPFEFISSKNWGWDTFRTALIQLAKKRAGAYIPAPKRPDFIHLDGLQATVAELRQISASLKNREVSRGVFADTQRDSLVISGKTHIGSDRQVKIDLQPEPGRENVQIPVLTIHVHPGSGMTQGLSDLDYISFLSDYRMIIMMICYQEGILFAMKTSATMVSSPDTIPHRIAEIRNDIGRIWSNFLLPDAILAFNKAVCLEFGMTLYRAPSSSENVAHRIEVTNL
jgi:hypothetical protein